MIGSIFMIIIVMGTHSVRSDEHAVHNYGHPTNHTEDEGQYLLVTLRDLLYNYTDDLYDFIKTHYGDTYDPVDEVTTDDDTEDDHETVTTVATESVENKYKSFEECRSWWKDTRYVERESCSTNPV